MVEIHILHSTASSFFRFFLFHSDLWDFLFPPTQSFSARPFFYSLFTFHSSFFYLLRDGDQRRGLLIFKWFLLNFWQSSQIIKVKQKLLNVFCFPPLKTWFRIIYSVDFPSDCVLLRFCLSFKEYLVKDFVLRLWLIFNEKVKLCIFKKSILLLLFEPNIWFRNGTGILNEKIKFRMEIETFTEI